MRRALSAALLAVAASCRDQPATAPPFLSPDASQALLPIPSPWTASPLNTNLWHGYTGGAASGVNDAGIIVGYQYNNSPAQFYNRAKVATRWDKDATGIYWPTYLASVANETASGALAVNTAGSIVGWAAVNNVSHAVRWNARGGVTLLPDGQAGQASDVNDAGVVAGYYTVAGLRRPAKWLANGQLVPLQLPNNSTRGEALGINNDGDIAGYATIAGVSRAVRWTSGGLILTYAPTGSFLTDINQADAASAVIGSWAHYQSPAGGFTPLFAGYAARISEKGRVVGNKTITPYWYLNGNSGAYPSPAGATHATALGVNTCGLTVGYSVVLLGSYSQFQPYMWSRPVCD